MTEAYAALDVDDEVDEVSYIGVIYGSYNYNYVLTNEDLPSDVDVSDTSYVVVNYTNDSAYQYQVAYGTLQVSNMGNDWKEYTGLSYNGSFTYDMNCTNGFGIYTAFTGWTAASEVAYVTSVEFYDSTGTKIYTYDTSCIETTTLDEATDDELEAAIADAQAVLDAIVEGDYTEESVGLLEDIIAEAKAVLADDDASDAQNAVEIDELAAAVAALVLVEADTSDLEGAIADAEAIDTTIYTDDSVADLIAALEEAQAVLADESATQSEVNAATDALTDAINALVVIPVDTTYLETAIADAEDVDTSAYTEDSVADLTAALENAQTVLANADATQDEIDAATSRLNSAISALVANITTYSVAGTIYVSDEDAETTMTVTVTLDGDEVASVEALSMGTYTVEGLEAGTYTITISGGKYAPRSYEVEVSDDSISQDVELNPYGDVNGDGKVTTADVGLANSHAKGVTTLTDYQFVCADVNLDGSITTADVGKINSHAKGVTLLW